MAKKWLISGVVVVVVGAGAGLWSARGQDATPVAVVSTVMADSGVVTVAVAATGALEASSTRGLSFTVDGTVDLVKVRAGTKVKAGAVLASVDDTAATEAVMDARESLASAEDQLAEAEDVAEAAVAGAATAAEVAAAGSAQAGAQAAAVPDAGQVQGGDAVYTAQIKVNRAEVALAEAKDALAGTVLKAPIGGTVLTVAGKVGSQMPRSSTFVTLAATGSMRVTADFPEADAGDLKVGQPATITLADHVGEEFAAEVVQVDPVGSSDGTLVTYGVVLAFGRAPAELLVGQSAAVEVRTGQVKATVRVPSTAVHGTEVLVRSGGAPVRRTVEVGLRGDQFTQVSSGLKAGEVVVRSW